MPYWPERIDPARAGLSTADLLQLVNQPHHDADDIALLKAAGFTVIPASRADASAIPAAQRTPQYGVVVFDDSPAFRINPVLWQELKGAEDEAAQAAAALGRLGAHVPVPFWLMFLPPTPRAVLLADLDDGGEPSEILPLPEVDQIDQWADVDPQLVADAAASSLVLTMGSMTHPLTYKRGSANATSSPGHCAPSRNGWQPIPRWCRSHWVATGATCPNGSSARVRMPCRSGRCWPCRRGSAAR